MKKNKKFLLLLISVVILLFSVSMLFSGCGRRARIAEVLKEKESENVGAESIDEDADTEEVTDKKDVDGDEDADTGEVTEDEDIDTGEVTEEGDGDTEEDIDEDEGEDEDVEEEIIDDEEEVEQSDDAEQFTADIPFVRSECGNIIGGIAYSDDPVIYPGDNGENDLEVRGFMSFDTSGLAGATVIESKISATADALFGTPFDTYGPLIIKAVHWGSRAFTPADYDLSGVELGSFTKKNFGMQNKNLKEDLQRAIDSGSGRHQLIFYFEMSGTDGDGQADSITYYLEGISLNITYTQ